MRPQLIKLDLLVTMAMASFTGLQLASGILGENVVIPPTLAANKVRSSFWNRQLTLLLSGQIFAAVSQLDDSVSITKQVIM